MPDFSLHPIDMTIIGLYAAFIVWLGLRLGKKHHTAEDYFLAGRRMIWPFIGVSLFASNISSTTLIGLAGDAYSTGISVFNYEWFATVILVFFVIFILPFVLKSQVYTIPEFLERRYDGRARTYFSILNLFLNIIVDTAASLYVGGLMLKLIFPDIPIWQTIGVLAVVAGIYTVAGGLAAVIYTDAIQTVLLLMGSIIISVTAFSKVGGWSAITAHVSPDMISLIRPLGDPGVPWLGLFTGLPLLGVYFWCNNQFMVQRVLSAKNLWHGRLGSLFAGLLKLPVLFIMVLPGTAAILLYPNLERADLVYPTLLFDLLPTGLLGLVMAGFIAALMSQIDSTLNSASTLVTLDFVAKARPDLSQHKLMVVGRWVTLIFMILAALWAPQIDKVGSIWKYLQSVLSYTVPPVVAMFLVGIFWKRANAQGAFLSLVVGVLLAVVFFYLNELAGILDIHFLYIAPILFVVCVTLLITGSLLTQPPDKEQVEELTWTKAFYRSETAELQSLPWYKNYRTLSFILTIMTIALVVAFR
ncbi:MAG: sodium:solute symporter [Candidatus Marinimicrobia bacterium]|jgi:SSS family solute:Na+ symporter|nr:sodium:solute symporter [Candidatus Neomarinimicrobiota bacterium]